MAEAPSWRKIEVALVEFFRGEGYWTDEDAKTGDRMVDEGNGAFINLTDLAKYLEDHLS